MEVSATHRSVLIDWAIVVGIAVYGAIWLQTEVMSPDWIDYAVLAGASGVLSVRRQFPVAVVVALLVLRVARAFGENGDAFVTMALFVGCFTVAERCRLWIATLIGATTVAVFLASAAAMNVAFSWAVASSTFGFLGAAIASGYAVASQRNLATQRANAAHREAMAAKLQAQSALRVEREKLAADLHDVLAHHVNVTVVLAESGRFAEVDDQVQTFETIASSGRQALTELDRILGLIHHERDTLPAPDIGRAAELIEQVSAAGFEVELHSTGSFEGVDAATSTTLYRVVQEGLTNVIKHSTDTWVRIVLSSRIDKLDVAVSSAPAPAVDVCAGRGLNGLTERTALIGGSFTVTNTAEKFEIRAVVPKAVETT